MSRLIQKDDLNDVDYQVKTDELLKEILFYRQYGGMFSSGELNVSPKEKLERTDGTYAEQDLMQPPLEKEF